MTTIPASSLLPGDRVVRCEPEPGLVGWSVAEVLEGELPPFSNRTLVYLLSLERQRWSQGPRETRTAYIKADTMLTVERSSE